ncbi:MULTISPECIES: hypothetical protein [unclassified Bradyrhizobium]|uniref:hypothetical protein n=1 Tax=unclassified Bradyrhizobium TaxID=2631580 RepID=UPI002915E874|nr:MULTISPECIES: hypothetical protein [unclassified Bradyrhizobium]
MYDFSDLHYLRIKRVRHTSSGRFATIVSAAICDEKPTRCFQCGGPLRGHGTKATTFRDLPSRHGGVVIVIDRLRFRCTLCGTTALQPVAATDYRYRMTDRLVERIRIEAVRRPFMAIAADCWVHEKTVRRIVKDRIPRLISRAPAIEDSSPT